MQTQKQKYLVIYAEKYDSRAVELEPRRAVMVKRRGQKSGRFEMRVFVDARSGKWA